MEKAGEIRSCITLPVVAFTFGVFDRDAVHSLLMEYFFIALRVYA